MRDGKDPFGDSVASARERLDLYRRATRAMGAFFARFTSRYCASCLEVTRRYHRDDPRADVDLLDGIFPGCCHAGVGDALWVPRSGEEGRFSDELAGAMVGAREDLGPGRAAPLEYSVRERRTGLSVRGVACIHLEPSGCRLGDLKGPLCVSYLCEPVRDAMRAAGGATLVGSDTDDFCGALESLRAVVGAGLDEALLAVAALEDRLRRGAELLEQERGEGLL